MRSWTILKEELIGIGIEFAEQQTLDPKLVNGYLKNRGEQEIAEGERIARLLKRPKVRFSELLALNSVTSSTEFGGRLQALNNKRLVSEVLLQIEIELKYEGYIKRQLEQVEQFNRLEGKRIPRDLDYTKLRSISAEARE